MKSRLLASALVIFLLQSGCSGASPPREAGTPPDPSPSSTVAQSEATASVAPLPSGGALSTPTTTSLPAEPPSMPSEPVTNPAVPADFQIEYEWHEGSLPPPYHYEYTIRIGPGAQGEIVFLPDYPSDDTPVWTEPFPVSSDTLAALYTLVEERGIFSRTWIEEDPPAIGGSVEWAEITAEGTRVSIPARLDSAQAAVIGDLYDAVRAAVPESVWARLRRQHEEYQQGQ